MKRKLSKFAAVCLLGTMLQGGCSFNGLARNVWAGFGYAIGGIPAQFVVDFLLGAPADDAA